MPIRPRITAYCLDWHVGKSDAFVDMLVDPLKPYADIELTAWDGEYIPANSLNDPILVFIMLLPPDSFLKKYRGRIVWLPMWDQAQGYDQLWWDRLPKNVFVVAFSGQINSRSTKAGLPTLKIKYFKDPGQFGPTEWDQGYVVFYWNRTGLIGPDFLKNLCQSVEAKKLIFLSDIDPRISKDRFYTMPRKIGKTKIVILKHSGRAEYLAAVEQANIFIAPRASEGVGMTFLEAMVRGAAVIAYDAPTMNEYISTGRNGLLLRNQPRSLIDRLRGARKIDSSSGEIFHLSSDQDWHRISQSNFKRLGDRARSDHIKGSGEWESSIAGYARFVLSDT